MKKNLFLILVGLLMLTSLGACGEKKEVATSVNGTGSVSDTEVTEEAVPEELSTEEPATELASEEILPGNNVLEDEYAQYWVYDAECYTEDMKETLPAELKDGDIIYSCYDENYEYCADYIISMPEGVAKAAGLAYIMDGCSGHIKVTYSEIVSCEDKYYTMNWDDTPVPCYILKDAVVEYLDVQYMEYTGDATSYMDMDLSEMVDVVVVIIENGEATGQAVQFN